MNDIYNIRKIESFKEYLNQRGVSPRVLNNVRINEILDRILDDFCIINIDEEAKNILDKVIKINIDGSISYVRNNHRIKIGKKDNGIILREDIYDKNTSSVKTERRYFKNNGIEYKYEIEEGKVAKEGFEKNLSFIPIKKTRYRRDENMFYFIIKEENNRGITSRRFLMQSTQFMLQNLKLCKKDFTNCFSSGTNIESICEEIAQSQAEYDTIKEIFSENGLKSQEEMFKSYKNNNLRYAKTTIYEKAVAKELGVNIERT